jgi:hypothetical protein
MSIHITHSKNRHSDTAPIIGLYVMRWRAVCRWMLEKHTCPAVFRALPNVLHFLTISRQISGLEKWIRRILKTRDLIADITLNTLFAVSTGTRVFYRQFQLK